MLYVHINGHSSKYQVAQIASKVEPIVQTGEVLFDSIRFHLRYLDAEQQKTLNASEYKYCFSDTLNNKIRIRVLINMS